MRYWRITLALLFVAGLFGEKGEVLAQSEERPIYLYTKQGDDGNYNWTDPEKATVYVFREPVPEGESGGRMIPKAEAKTKRGWPTQEQFVGRTSVVESEGSPFGSGALRTGDSFPNKMNGEQQRYLLVIDTGSETYQSRTITSKFGNLPRYHTLENPATVRVQQAHREWQNQTENLISRAKKWADSSDTSASNAKADIPENTASRQKTKSASDTTEGISQQVSNDGFLEVVPLQGIEWTWLGGGGVFGLLMFFVGMSVGGSGSSGSGDPSRRRRSGSSSKGRSRSESRDFPKSNLPGDEDESSDVSAEVQQLREDLREAEEKIDVLEETLEDQFLKMYKQVIEPLRKDVKRLEKEIEDDASDVQSDGGVSPESSSQGAVEKVAEAFLSWCQRGKSVRKLDRFERHLQENVRGAEVRAIQYEQDAMGKTFVDDARNGITYWLITLEGQQFVFPRPVNRSRFESLGPVYKGKADPSSLDGIEPASLAKKAGSLVLDEEGRVW
jgi:hypothetical protein